MSYILSEYDGCKEGLSPVVQQSTIGQGAIANSHGLLHVQLLLGGAPHLDGSESQSWVRFSLYS